jgi:hypothetical protein
MGRPHYEGCCVSKKYAVISPYYSLSGGSVSTLDWSTLLSVLEEQLRQAARREGVVLAFDFRH